MRRLAAVQVVDDRGDVVDLRLQRVTEQKRLNDRDDQHEKQCRRLAADVEEFFDEDGKEAVHLAPSPSGRGLG